ncbi:MAG: glutathione S-transferase family protein, partial [Pseudomonadales bacterium]
MITVWGRRNSTNLQKVMWAIGELGLEYDRQDVGGTFGGLSDDNFVAMNPNKMIPVLQDGSVTVWESHAIIRYLAARYGDGSLWPTDVANRAQADQWMDWMHTTFSPSFFGVFLGLIRTPKDKIDQEKVSEHAEQLGRVWGILDQHLKNSDYVAGDALSIGDLPLGVACYR